MKLFRKTIATLLAVLLVLSLSTPAFAVAKATTSTMKLQSISGTVSITKSTGKAVTYKAGMTLHSGYTITTAPNSYANISVDGAKAFKVDALSSVSFSKSGKKLDLYVNSGNVYFNITEKLFGDESMNIHTPTMTAGIRSTVGIITVSRDGTAGGSTLSLLEGSVNVVLNNAAGISTVSVAAGQAVNVAARTGAMPNTPVLVTFKAENIPGFVAVEIAADPKLKARLELSVGGNVDIGAVAERAQQRLEQDQQQQDKELRELEQRLKDEVKRSAPVPTKPVAPSGGSGDGGFYTSYDYLVTTADETITRYTAEQSFTVPAHATLKLLRNVGSSGAEKELLAQAPADDDAVDTAATIDLNGFTFYGTVTAVKDSKLDIVDNTSGKAGEIRGTVTVGIDAALSITGVTVDAGDALALDIQGGTAALDGATIKNSSSTNVYADPNAPAPTPDITGYPTVNIAPGAKLEISGENSVSNNSSGLVIKSVTESAESVVFDETAYGCLNLKVLKDKDASSAPYHYLMNWLRSAPTDARYEDISDSSYWGVAYFNNNYELAGGGDTAYGLWTDGGAPAPADGDRLTLLHNINFDAEVSGPVLEIPEASDVTLDLNGRTLSANCTGSVVTAKLDAKLTVMDSSAAQTGMIKNAGRGNVIFCAQGGIIILQGGTLRTTGAEPFDVASVEAAATLKYNAPDAAVLKVYVQPKAGDLDLGTLFADFNTVSGATACYVDLYKHCNMNSPFSIGDGKLFDLNGHGKTITYAGTGTAFTLGSNDTSFVERYIRNVEIKTADGNTDSQTLLKVAQGTVLLGDASLTNNSADKPTVIIAVGKTLGSTGGAVTNTITNNSATGRVAEREEGELESVGSFCGVILRVAKGETTSEVDARDRIGTSEGILGLSLDGKYWMATISSDG